MYPFSQNLYPSVFPLFILFPSPPLSLSSAPPLLPLSACCPESKWQQLSLNAKPRSHAKLTPQVFWVTLSVHRAWLPSAPPVRSDRSPRGVRYGEGRRLVFLKQRIRWSFTPVYPHHTRGLLGNIPLTEPKTAIFLFMYKCRSGPSFLIMIYLRNDVVRHATFLHIFPIKSELMCMPLRDS